MCRDGYRTTCPNCGAAATCRDVDAEGICAECYDSVILDDDRDDLPMIDRPPRALQDGCHTCMRSQVYCDAVVDPVNGFGRACCDQCSHASQSTK